MRLFVKKVSNVVELLSSLVWETEFPAGSYREVEAAEELMQMGDAPVTCEVVIDAAIEQLAQTGSTPASDLVDLDAAIGDLDMNVEAVEELMRTGSARATEEVDINSAAKELMRTGSAPVSGQVDIDDVKDRAKFSTSLDAEKGTMMRAAEPTTLLRPGSLVARVVRAAPSSGHDAETKTPDDEPISSSLGGATTSERVLRMRARSSVSSARAFARHDRARSKRETALRARQDAMRRDSNLDALAKARASAERQKAANQLDTVAAEYAWYRQRYSLWMPRTLTIDTRDPEAASLAARSEAERRAAAPQLIHVEEVTSGLVSM